MLDRVLLFSGVASNTDLRLADAKGDGAGSSEDIVDGSVYDEKKHAVHSSE